LGGDVVASAGECVHLCPSPVEHLLGLEPDAVGVGTCGLGELDELEPLLLVPLQTLPMDRLELGGRLLSQQPRALLDLPEAPLCAGDALGSLRAGRGQLLVGALVRLGDRPAAGLLRRDEDRLSLGAQPLALSLGVTDLGTDPVRAATEDLLETLAPAPDMTAQSLVGAPMLQGGLLARPCDHGLGGLMCPGQVVLRLLQELGDVLVG